MTNLTDRQALVLAYVKRYVSAHGFPPTRAEIADGLGFRSATAAEEHLKALERKGAVEITRGVSRGLRVTNTALLAA